jgi:tetratricopeptide (TPR) repeat protein
MRRMAWAAGLALFAGGCAPTVQERVHDCNEDGVNLFHRGRYDPARECFQAALALQPENADLLYNLGQCFERLGNVPRAEQLYHECLQRSPDHAECRHALSLLLLHDGRRPEAVRLCEEWLQHTRTPAAAYAEDGWLYAQANDPIRAVKRFQQAIDHDPHNVLALTELGHVYEETMHYPDRALYLYRQALRVNSDQPDVARRVAALQKQGVGPPHPED